VIEAAGAPAGRLYVARWPREIRIMDIALLPAHRRRGLGTAILADLLAEATTTGKVASIHVERNNPALGLYERLGFRTAADRGVYLFLERNPAAAPAGGGRP
jgi:ribosomal protein S18 acetylase RimI-like enzyme